MVQANDHERHLITYELHDGVAQQLMAAKMLLQSPRLRRLCQSSAEAENIYLNGMETLGRASSEIRRVMDWLRTPVLDRYGIVEAIEDVAAQLRLMPGAPAIAYSHAVSFTRLEGTLENSLFRIAQEAMSNACRHSKSEKIEVNLTQKGAHVTLEVRDWGIGFDPSKVQKHRFGLEGMRERARILGGELSINSKPEQGTIIRVKLPVVESGSVPVVPGCQDQSRSE
jgi:two-component system sensor histidine kinase DegS